jgi:hypothetical protein
MAEGLILLLLVPAIVVPVVLLVGFAGCDQLFGLGHFDPPPPPSPPIIDAVLPKSGSGTVLTLVWHWNGSSPQGFQYKRILQGIESGPFDAPSAPTQFDDPGLEPGTTYEYQMRAVLSDGSFTDFSTPAVPGITNPFQTTFQQTLTSDEGAWEGFTLVQRIEKGRLSTSGTRVKISVLASTMSSAQLNRVYISREDPANKRYDSLQGSPDVGGLTAVYDFTTNQNQPFPVPATDPTQQPPKPVPLPEVNFNLDHNQALLIAIEFSASPGSGIRFVQPIAATDATAYWRSGAEAAIATRSAGYTQPPQAGTDRILLIATIEVG